MANSAFSVVGLAHKLFLAGETQGHTPETFNKLAENPTLLGDILNVLEGRACIVPIDIEMKSIAQATRRNTLTVLPSLTLAERIAAGMYYWNNSEITSERFPDDPTTIGKWEWELVGYDHRSSSKNTKAALEVDGWVSAKWEHLLAFGTAFPEAQCKNPIIALGSVCSVDGSRFVLGLWRVSGGRCVHLRRWDDVWRSFFRFLRVRKILNT